MRTAVTYTSINGATNGAWRAEHTGNSTVAEIVIEGMWERRNSALGKRSRLMGKTSTVRTVELWSLASLADVVMDQFVSRDNFKVEFLTPNQWSDDQAGKPVPMPALGGAAAFPLRFLDYLIYEPIRAVLLHGGGVPVLIPSPERYAIHKLIVGSRRKQERDGTAKSAKDRLQARSIIAAMIENRQHADLASAFMEAWERGDQWRAAIRTSIATYDDDFQTLLRTEFAKGVSEFGSDPANYDLVDKSIDKPAPSPE